MARYNFLDGLAYDGEYALPVPEIPLPEDIGDGPFASPTPRRSEVFDVGAPGSSTQKDFPEGTHGWAGPDGPRSVARIFVSDIIPAQSFRRFNHGVSLTMRQIEGAEEVIVAFQGAAAAVLAEKINDASAARGAMQPGPPPGLGDVLVEGLNTANRVAENESTSADGSLDFRTPLPPSQSFYAIRFRRPAVEFGWSAGVNFDPNTPAGQGERLANQVEEFNFNVDSRKEFRLFYPMGRSIPVTFDVVNRNTRSISADFYVDVLLNG